MKSFAAFMCADALKNKATAASKKGGVSADGKDKKASGFKNILGDITEKNNEKGNALRVLLSKLDLDPSLDMQNNDILKKTLRNSKIELLELLKEKAAAAKDEDEAKKSDNKSSDDDLAFISSMLEQMFQISIPETITTSSKKLTLSESVEMSDNIKEFLNRSSEKNDGIENLNNGIDITKDQKNIKTMRSLFSSIEKKVDVNIDNNSDTSDTEKIINTETEFSNKHKSINSSRKRSIIEAIDSLIDKLKKEVKLTDSTFISEQNNNSAKTSMLETLLVHGGQTAQRTSEIHHEKLKVVSGKSDDVAKIKHNAVNKKEVATKLSGQEKNVKTTDKILDHAKKIISLKQQAHISNNKTSSISEKTVSHDRPQNDLSKLLSQKGKDQIATKEISDQLGVEQIKNKMSQKQFRSEDLSYKVFQKQATVKTNLSEFLQNDSEQSFSQKQSLLKNKKFLANNIAQNVNENNDGVEKNFSEQMVQAKTNIQTDSSIEKFETSLMKEDAAPTLPQQKNIFNSIVKNVNYQMKNNISKLTLQLTPEHLGKIDVNVEFSDKDGVSAKLVVENAEVRTVVADNLSSIKQQLSEQGVDVNKLDILTQSEQSFSQNSEQKRQQMNKRRNKRNKMVQNIQNTERSHMHSEKEVMENGSNGEMHSVNLSV